MDVKDRDGFSTPVKKIERLSDLGSFDAADDLNTASTQCSPCLRDVVSPSAKPVERQSYGTHRQQISSSHSVQPLASWLSVVACLAISAVMTCGCSSQAIVGEDSPHSTMSQNQSQLDHIQQQENKQQSAQYLQIIAAVPTGQTACDYISEVGLNTSQSNVRQVQRNEQQTSFQGLLTRLQHFLQFHRNAHRVDVIRPEQVAIAKVIESRLKDVFALMAMFILLQKLLEVGVPDLFSKFKSTIEGIDLAKNQTDQSTAGADDPLYDLKQQVALLSMENDHLRQQIADERSLSEPSSLNTTQEFAEHESPRQELDKIKEQYTSDLKSWSSEQKGLESKYQKLKQISRFKKEKADSLHQKLEQVELEHQQEVAELKQQLVSMAQSLALIVKIQASKRNDVARPADDWDPLLQ